MSIVTYFELIGRYMSRHSSRLWRVPAVARKKRIYVGGFVRHLTSATLHLVASVRCGAGNGGPFGAHVLRRAERTAGDTKCGDTQANDVHPFQTETVPSHRSSAMVS